VVLVVCPNLALDHTLHLEELKIGRVHRTRDYERRAGGKGVNAARALSALGEVPLLCGLVGGGAGRLIEEELAREKIPAELVPMQAENRTCVIVLSRSGEATVVNETGPTVTEAEALRARVRSLIGESQAVALMGSLPPGLPEDLYAEAVSECRRAAVPCLVDTAGPALENALSAGPTYAKPNQMEAEALLGRKIRDWHAAAQEIRRRGANVAMITRGARAAFLSSPAFDARLSPPGVPVVNPTGAGDAFAAGLLAGHLRGGSLREAVVLGMAAAAASVQHGYGRVRPAEIHPELIGFETL
jgi:tagatose 6-phosphate kinase